MDLGRGSIPCFSTKKILVLFSYLLEYGLWNANVDSGVCKSSLKIGFLDFLPYGRGQV